MAADRSEQQRNRAVGRPFQKGQSGNPGGRPKETAEVRELARQHTIEAVERLVAWMRSDEPKASVAACNAILDRGWGKPLQSTELSGAGGTPLVPILNVTYGDGRSPGQSQPAS
jgi:hypothetical protein